MKSLLTLGLGLVLVLGVAWPAAAQHEGHAHPPAPHATARVAAPHGANAHGADAHGADTHGADTHGADTHGADAHGADAHGKGAHGHHEAPGKFNFAQGLLGESDEGEPGLLWRRPGTAPPFLAMILNSAVVLSLLFFALRGPVQRGLAERRTALLRNMEEAAEMKAQAQARVAELQDRLDHLDEEIERVRDELRRNSERDRERVLAEARARAESMQRESAVMIELELKAARERLQAEVITRAMAEARALLAQRLTGSDHRRLFDRYVGELRSLGLGPRGAA